MSKVWFISGGGAGTAKAAWRAGNRVITTGRNLDKVSNACGVVASENIAFVQLDVSDEGQPKAAVEQAGKQFGRADVVLNSPV
jgi:NADP-dependent 3-hydroxy acid dehydrogenase YdfG